MTGINEFLTFMFILEALGTLAFVAIVLLMVWIALNPPSD